jgi:hypothetical protein
MLASRSVVSRLLRGLGEVSLHPQGRPCGRPPAAAVLAPATTQRPPGNRPHPHAGHEPTPRRTKDVLPRPSEGQIPVLPGLMQSPIPAGLMLVIELVLVGPAGTPPPQPCPHTPDPVQHGQPPRPRPLSSLPDPTTREAPNRDLHRTAGPHRGHIRPERQGQHRLLAGGQRPSSAARFSQHRRSSHHPVLFSHGGKPGCRSLTSPHLLAQGVVGRVHLSLADQSAYAQAGGGSPREVPHGGCAVLARHRAGHRAGAAGGQGHRPPSATPRTSPSIQRRHVQRRLGAAPRHRGQRRDGPSGQRPILDLPFPRDRGPRAPNQRR